MESYHEIVLRSLCTELYYGIIRQNDIMESYEGILLRKYITKLEMYYGADILWQVDYGRYGTANILRQTCYVVHTEADLLQPMYYGDTLRQIC